MNVESVLLESEVKLKAAEEIGRMSDRLHISSDIMDSLDILYKALCSDGTRYYVRREEARAYGNLMHNCRNRHSTLYYRAKLRDEVPEQAQEIPFQVSDAVLNEFWITIRELILSSIGVLRTAYEKNKQGV